ncbi:MAG: hypothetical protein MUF64_14440 [Polyangiaceae bacterium]|jgi:hypothetical protein|nr:hypothetical protein [Polyangiaceae bacterium]
MSERVYTLEELNQPRWKQLVSRTFDGAAARFVAASLALVGGALGVFVIQGHLHEERARAQVLAQQAAAVAQISEAERSMASLIDGLAMKTAREPWQGDFVAPGLRGDELLAQPGVYFRAVQTEVGSPQATRTAANLSVKDAVPLCLLQGTDVEEAGACLPGTACMGQRTERISNLRQLHQGLDVLSEEWTRDLQTASGMRLGALAGTLKDRLARATPEAQRIAASARYALLVLDEIPADLPEQMWGSRREVVQNYPHAVRLALFDARTGAPLAKIRRELDPSMAPVIGAAAWEGPARRQAYGCLLGLELRSAITRR